MFIKIDSKGFSYRFMQENRWLHFAILFSMLIIVKFYFEFEIEIIAVSFISSFFAILAAFKLQIKGIQLENPLALLFIFFAFMIGFYSDDFSRVITHLNILLGMFFAFVIMTFVFKIFYKNN